jgi:hypothetical protein
LYTQFCTTFGGHDLGTASELDCRYVKAQQQRAMSFARLAAQTVSVLHRTTGQPLPADFGGLSSKKQ